MTSIRQLKPFIPSGPDFQRAKDFFRELGFEVAWEADGLAELQLGEAAFLLQQFDNPIVQNNLMMLAVVDDLDSWWQRILDSGVLAKYGVHAKPPIEYPWGQREVHLIDPAGVCWHFA